MVDEPTGPVFHMKDDNVKTNVRIGKDAGYDSNGVRLNNPELPEPIAVEVTGDAQD